MCCGRLVWLRVCLHSGHFQVKIRVLIILVKIPKPKETDQPEGEDAQKKESELDLPQTLVRIPTEHAPMLQQATGEGAAEE